MPEIFVNVWGTKSMAVNNCNEILRVLFRYFHKLYSRACGIIVAFMSCDAVADDAVPADKIFSTFEFLCLSKLVSLSKVFEFFRSGVER